MDAHRKSPIHPNIDSCHGAQPDDVPGCTCPDLTLTLRIRIASGSTISRTWSCLCCEGRLDPTDMPLGR